LLSPRDGTGGPAAEWITGAQIGAMASANTPILKQNRGDFLQRMIEMTDPESPTQPDPTSSKKEDNVYRTAIVPAAFTLLGVVITAGAGWLAAAQTSSFSSKQACVARIDTREATVRKKADAFLTAQGSMLALATHKAVDRADFEKRLDQIGTTGYSLISYVDDEFAKTTVRMTLQLGELLNAKTSAEESTKVTPQLKETQQEWNQQFRARLDAFQNERKGC